jgi:hypothetical protein
MFALGILTARKTHQHPIHHGRQKNCKESREKSRPESGETRSKKN